MANKAQRSKGKPALDLIEEAIHLLRLAPASTFVLYGVGTFPFVLGFLYFWADMSRSASAELHSGSSALGLAFLFVWMRTCQTVFASKLREQVARGTSGKWTARRLVTVFVQQGIIQPIALFILPLSAITVLSFSWVYAFFQNFTVFGDGQSPAIKESMRRALKQAKLSQAQNHGVLLISFLFGLFIVLNVMTAIVTVPGFIKTFLGIETVFTLSGKSGILNSTLVLATFAMVYLCLDPLMKAVYVLRCFYGESLVTGEDLRVQLSASKGRLNTGIALVVLIFASAFQGMANDKPVTGQGSEGAGISELNQSIDRTINKREYAWRLPREHLEKAAKEEGWIEGALRSIQETITGWARSLRDSVRSIFDWLEKVFNKKPVPERDSSDGSGTAWMSSLQWLLFILIAVLCSVIGVLFYRMWKQRRRKPDVVLAEALPAVPDLTREDVTASQLPEDGWLQLARELMDQGELRLALRAFYLASLAHLAQREFVSIAKFKSNRDYETELRRRARSQAELQNAFSENVDAFDRVWYGKHEVTGDGLQQFQNNLDRIRAC